MFQDRKIAIAYAIEALRVFDHLHFRTRMKEAGVRPNPPKKKTASKKRVDHLVLKKPASVSHTAAWFEKYYVPDSQNERDRELFVK